MRQSQEAQLLDNEQLEEDHTDYNSFITRIPATKIVGDSSDDSEQQVELK